MIDPSSVETPAAQRLVPEGREGSPSQSHFSPGPAAPCPIRVRPPGTGRSGTGSESPPYLIDTSRCAAERIGDLAAVALLQELNTWPKPGLVSPADSGSHRDMDAAMFRASAAALQPFFTALAAAGAEDAGMDELRTIGRAAERSMLAVTGAVNTHRGAIFSLGLLCAAAGALRLRDGPSIAAAGALGAFVRRRWGSDILSGPPASQSHGTRVRRLHGAGGARAEAAAGFPHVYRAGLPALIEGQRRTDGDDNAARVQACFALISEVEDTNLLHRGGVEGLRFARQAAKSFLEQGGVGKAHWQNAAAAVHQAFVARRLSPGGSADLLAATLLVSTLERAPVPHLG